MQKYINYFQLKFFFFKIHILSFSSLDHRTQSLTNVLKMIFRGVRLHARLFPKCLNCQKCQNCQNFQNLRSDRKTNDPSGHYFLAKNPFPGFKNKKKFHPSLPFFSDPDLKNTENTSFHRALKSKNDDSISSNADQWAVRGGLRPKVVEEWVVCAMVTASPSVPFFPKMSSTPYAHPMSVNLRTPPSPSNRRSQSGPRAL